MIRKIFQILKEKYFSEINNKLDYLLVHSNKSQSVLSLLCDLHGSDKGSLSGRPAHTYTSVYDYLFSPIRFDVKLLLECGIGTNNPNLPATMGINGRPGASLRVWRDYFPNAQIIGVDIDKEILFTEDRIQTGFVDQTLPETILNFFVSLPSEYQNNFDIIIDDGLHTFEAAICLLENSFSQLKDNGLYIIEDMSEDDILKFKEYVGHTPPPPYIQFLQVQYMIMPIYSTLRNNMIIIHKSKKRG
jgi:SAM-dependent methyltransferase